MTSKYQYTADEWDMLLTAPAAVTTFISTADIKLVGMIKEIRAAAKAIEKIKPEAPAKDLVDSIVTDLQQRAEADDSPSLPQVAEGEDPREPARIALDQLGTLLDQKSTSAEAAAFKNWLLAIGQAVAEAAKEGGFLGIGGERVSDAEKDALAEMKSLLRI